MQLQDFAQWFSDMILEYYHNLPSGMQVMWLFMVMGFLAFGVLFTCGMFWYVIEDFIKWIKKQRKTIIHN